MTSTAAVVSLVTRRKLAALMCDAGSAAIASSERLHPAVGGEVDQVGAAQHAERGVGGGEQAAEGDEQHGHGDEDADHCAAGHAATVVARRG